MNEDGTTLLMASELIFPLPSLSVFNALSEHYVILSEEVSARGKAARKIVAAASDNKDFVVHLYFQSGEEELVSASSADEWFRLINEDAGFTYSSDFYFEMSNRNLCGYSSQRDTLAVLAVRRALITIPQDIVDWDDLFVVHLQETGIGFGDEGRAYARSLFRELPEPRSSSFVAAL